MRILGTGLLLGLLLVAWVLLRIDQHRTRDQEAEQQGFLVGTPERPFTRL